MTSTNIKSPYFRNTLQADDFEDKVHMLRDKPYAIAIGFDTDPNEVDSAFEIACRKTETEGELVSSLVYVITKLAEMRGLRAKITFTPVTPYQKVQIMQEANAKMLADQLVEQMNPTVQEKTKLSSILGLFKRKPPNEPTNV